MSDRPAMAAAAAAALECLMARMLKIRVEAPPHLCRVQRATRELCRSAGFSEAAVFEAVLEATDSAYRLLLERARAVDLTVSVRRARGLESVTVSAAP